jgi:hypothetical protein
MYGYLINLLVLSPVWYHDHHHDREHDHHDHDYHHYRLFAVRLLGTVSMKPKLLFIVFLAFPCLVFRSLDGEMPVASGGQNSL